MWSKYLFDLKHVWVAPGGGDCGKGGNLMWERCSCKYDLKFAIVCVLALWLCWNLKCEWLYGLLSDISWRSDWLCAVWWIDWGELRIFGLRCFFTGIHFFQMFKFVVQGKPQIFHLKFRHQYLAVTLISLGVCSLFFLRIPIWRLLVLRLLGL